MVGVSLPLHTFILNTYIHLFTLIYNDIRPKFTYSEEKTNKILNTEHNIKIHKI